MATYLFTIADSSGKRLTARVDAANALDAAKTAARDGWFVVSVREDLPTNFFSRFTKASAGMSAKERILFTDHLASMIASGTPLVEALETYGEETSEKKSVMTDTIVRSVVQGKKLSESMRAFPKVFSPYYLAMVAAGELTGRLDETFTHLARELRRQYEFTERIKSAMLYPALVLIVAALVMTLLVFLVIPKITDLTNALGGDVPIATKIVGAVAKFLTKFGVLVVAGFFGGIIALFAFLKNPKTKARIDPWLLRSPLIGKVMRQYAVARFLRLVGSCLTYGIPISVTFDTVADVMGNTVYRESALRLKKRVMHGQSLAAALTHEPKGLFPSIIIRSIRGAEKTGTIDAACLRLSVMFEQDVDRNLKHVTDLVEPVLTIVLGIIVAGIALAVVTPIYQLTAKIK